MDAGSLEVIAAVSSNLPLSHFVDQSIKLINDSLTDEQMD